jgi:hypothetical protein
MAKCFTPPPFFVVECFVNVSSKQVCNKTLKFQILIKIIKNKIKFELDCVIANIKVQD